MTHSRISGFHKLSMQERLAMLDGIYHFTTEEHQALTSNSALSRSQADHMIENAVALYPLPFGTAMNFEVNHKDYIVPMAIEEPSVIAAASHIAKIVRKSGGFHAETTERVMIGQVQVVGCPDIDAANQALLNHRQQLLDEANASQPSMVRRSGGAIDIAVRLLENPDGSHYQQMLILHLFINTCDAMGANTINTMVEAIAPTVESLTGGRVYLQILSNYTDRCLARAHCEIPPAYLSSDTLDGESVRDRIVAAYEFAANDVYRAVTHNKGVMNGIDAVVIATGNDWRAIEAGAHAYASRFGHYTSMTTWSVNQKGNLVGFIELPMPVGTVGGSIGIHPMAQLGQKILSVKSAAELAQVIVTVGLAQNLGALLALSTHGIQKGHMALHARTVAMTAGATGAMIDTIAQKLVQLRDFHVSRARELMAQARDCEAAGLDT